MRFITTLILLTAAMVLKTGAAIWYLDSAATGANNGTNWANAWVSPTNVVWGGSGVKAGDTLTIAGGYYTNNGMAIGAGGNSSNWLRIEASREAGKNSKVVLKSISLGGFQWIWISGAKDTNVPFQYGGVILTNRAALTNNIGIQLTSPDQGSTYQGIYVNADSGANQRVEWVEFGPISSEVDTDSWDGYGIRFLNLTTNANFLVRGCWFHDIRNDNINLNDITGTPPSGYDATVVSSSWLQGGGDDGIQWVENGLSVVDNYFDGHLFGFFHGHPDHLQYSGSASRFQKVVNNVFNGNANSIIKGEHMLTEGGSYGDFIIAGNWFYEQANFPTNYDFGEPITLAGWRPNNSTNVIQAYQSNVYVLNNTFYHLPAGSGIPFALNRAVPGADTNTQATKSAWKIDAANGWFVNNLGVDNRYNSAGTSWSWAGSGAGGGPSDTNGIYYSSNQVRWVNNILSGGSSSRQFTYGGVTYTNGEALGMGNVSTIPSLISTNSRDLRLATNDTVAVGTGYNWASLDSLTNNHPELARDLFGNPRFRSGGVVDIGGSSLTSSSGSSGTTNSPITNGLLLAINFDIAPANDDAGYDDWSGNGNHGRHLGHMASHTASNRCPDQIVYTNRLTGLIETGAFFRRYPDGWDEYNNSGDYLGVTNGPSTNELWSMRSATILFWGRYDPPDSSHPDYTNTWNAEGNRRFIGAGYGYPGAWTIGLPSDGGPRSAFRVYPNTSATASYGYFNDRVNISQGSPMIGSSTNMRFYLVTWTNGFAQGYLDGVLQFSKTFTNSSGINVSNLTIRGPSGNRNGMLQIGGDTHNANPLLTYTNGAGVLKGDDGDGSFFEVTGAKQVPNHGWGGFCTLDDVRVYNRVISTNEMYQIMMKLEGSGSTGGGGGGGGSTPSTNKFITVTTSVSVGGNVTANSFQ